MKNLTESSIEISSLEAMASLEKNSITVFLSLGSSQEFSGKNSQQILEQACAEISVLGENPENFRVSDFITSEPWGGVAENIFVNAVCRIDVSREAYPENSGKPGEKIEDFLDRIQAIEKKFGRTRDKNSKHWADRTLDIDILFWGNEKISRPRLKIPHPYIWERDFMYTPLKEITSESEYRDLQKI